VLRDFEGTLQRLTGDKNGQDRLQSNIRHASCCFDALLYARVFILRLFLDVAVENNITENLQERWMLLQVVPMELIQRDIFAERTRLLGYYSSFGTEIEHELEMIRQYLKVALFCVVDEAQMLTTDKYAFPHCFCGSGAQGTPSLSISRPTLRHLISKWKAPLPNMIVSGTGVSIDAMETVLGSLVAKETGHVSETITDIGAFNDDKGQRSYMESYLPNDLLNSDSGKELVSRVGYWLHGR